MNTAEKVPTQPCTPIVNGGNHGELSLTNDGLNWNGTFLLLVQTLLADLLPEGPVTATATRCSDDGTTQTVKGLLVAVNDREVTFDDGYFVPMENLIGIGI